MLTGKDYQISKNGTSHNKDIRQKQEYEYIFQTLPHPEVKQETEKTEVHTMNSEVISKVKSTSKKSSSSKRKT